MKKLVFMFYLAVAVSVTSCDSLANKLRGSTPRSIDSAENTSKVEELSSMKELTTPTCSIGSSDAESKKKRNYEEDMGKWEEFCKKYRDQLKREEMLTPGGSWECPNRSLGEM
jgi:hypothetical protein